MFEPDRQQSEHLKKRLQNDQTLLDSIKANLRNLERLGIGFQGMYLDGIYRFYHQSFKVYDLQNLTLRAVELFRAIGQSPNRQLCSWFEEIIASGTGFEFQPEDNLNWTFRARPIVEAFLHAKYFVEMMTRCAHELTSAPTVLPSEWAAILELYNQR
ncbi:MAG TPA: hypothetical protein VJM12_00510 [Pyrinomonadaceae bacterium]|nr:hypothetical protein [Pyrinomonadaceae bacterium]